VDKAFDATMDKLVEIAHRLEQDVF
jgi:exonuclease VII small subunit